MADKGYFIITDISGYTEYLTSSELDHAHEILQSLLDAQIADVKQPFVISGFRGDAVFMYAPETHFIQPQSFIEALENFYVVFQDLLEQMQINTTCTCRACKNISLLDLKMCIHYGEYLLHTVADREELLGADVIVVHRMLKNSVIEKTQISSYALFSDVASKALDLPVYCSELKPHTETYEHIGEIPMWVYDLRPIWEQKKSQRRIFVDADVAWVKHEVFLPFPPSLIWEYLTNPNLEAGFLGLDSVQRVDTLGGRVREKSEFHCAHGEMKVKNQILDWKPFEYYTQNQTFLGVTYLQTRRLTPTENGTLVGFYLSKPAKGATDDIRQTLQMVCDTGLSKLGPYIEKDLAEGKVTVVSSAK